MSLYLSSCCSFFSLWFHRLFRLLLRLVLFLFSLFVLLSGFHERYISAAAIGDPGVSAETACGKVQSGMLMETSAEPQACEKAS